MKKRREITVELCCEPDDPLYSTCTLILVRIPSNDVSLKCTALSALFASAFTSESRKVKSVVGGGENTRDMYGLYVI
jgi:hypothetical protein